MDIIGSHIEEIIGFEIGAVAEQAVRSEAARKAGAAFKRAVLGAAAGHVNEKSAVIVIQNTVHGFQISGSAGEGQEIRAYIQHTAEQAPGDHATHGEAANGPVIPGSLEARFIGNFGIGAIGSFDQGHYFLAEFLYEFFTIVIGASAIVISGGHQNKGPNDAGRNHVIKGILGGLVADKGIRVAAPSVVEVNHRIPFRAVFIVAIGQIHVQVFFVCLIVHVGGVLHFDHSAGMLVRRFVEIPVVQQVMGGNACQLRLIQHCGRFLPAGQAGAAKQTEKQCQADDFFHTLSSFKSIEKQGPKRPPQKKRLT